MAKTLTDRTSVRVTAKSETDANNQKKNDANNIAKALGKEGDLDDTKASSVASKLGNTITDENGTTWAKSSEVAAAAKELDGEIDAEPEYDEYTTSNGYKIFHISALTGIARNGSRTIDGTYHRGDSTETWSGDMYISGTLTYNESTSEYYLTYSILSDGNDIMYEDSFSGYDGSSYSKTGIQIQAGNIQEGSFVSYILDYGPAFNEISPMLPFNGKVSLSPATVEAAVRNGGTHHGGGGSKVDTSKSEDQIKNELESKAWKQGKAAKINPIEPNETYIAVTDANGNPLYFLGT